MDQLTIFDMPELYPKPEFSFNDQVKVFVEYISKAFDYVEIIEVYEAKARMYRENRIIDRDVPVFINFASYVGSLLRIGYYKYVYKADFDVRALAEASVKAYVFNGVYRFEFEPYIRMKGIKKEIYKTRYPKWTKIGLLGGSTKEILDLGTEFGEWMEDENL